MKALVLCTFAALVLFLAPAGAAASPSPFTWAGQSTTSDRWSTSANWAGGTAPEAATEISTLTFPHLPECLTKKQREEHPCYVSSNNLLGLSAETIQLNDGNDYVIGGEQLSLGAGGLTATPAAEASGPAGAFVEMPFQLSASQQWSIADRSTGSLGENGMFLGGDVTGSSSALTLDLSNGPLAILANDTEVGPVTISGHTSGESITNGLVLFEDGEINSLNGHTVNLKNIFVAGSGALGELATEDAVLAVGSGFAPAEQIEAKSVKLDPASEVAFEITGHGDVAATDYSRLLAHGSVELAGASVEVAVRPGTEEEEEAGVCPVPARGTVYTLISTSGTLSGTFANAPEGGTEIPIRFANACPRESKTMRIAYNRSGGTETVTGTVEAAAQEAQEAKERHEAEEREHHEAEERKLAEERKAEERVLAEERVRAEERKLAGERKQAKEAQEANERALAKAAAEVKSLEEAAAAKKHQEELAKVGVLGITESSPTAALASTSLSVSASGAFVVKIECPAGEASCTGTITLRTLHAVSAGVSGHESKQKATILTLATGSFTVAGGQSKALTLHLLAKARPLLAHSRTLSARATIVAHNPAGATHTGQTVVTLRASKSKKGKT